MLEMGFFLVVAFFLVGDEEPILDFSDWNLYHTVLTIICFFLIITETRLRAGIGQVTSLDDTVQLAALFW